MARVWSFVAALTLAAWIPAAYAQRTTGEISGKVLDESGLTLPGVTVTLHGEGVPGAPSVVTSETGAYRFPVLPAGAYDTRVRARRDLAPRNTKRSASPSDRRST